jgi:hypothetical protein
MSSKYFGKSVTEMAEIISAENREWARRSQARWDAGIEDDCFVSEKCEAQDRSDMRLAADLAAQGWRCGFVGLCRLDGTPARGRWIESKWRGRQDSWGTPKANGERGLDFIPGELLLASREGDQDACDKLRARGFQWEMRRLNCDIKRTYPVNGRGFEGLYYSNLFVIPVDRDGAEVCTDALCYSAESFFVGAACDAKYDLLIEADAVAA